MNDQAFSGTLHRLTQVKYDHAVQNCSACKTDISKSSSYCCVACVATTATWQAVHSPTLQHPTTVKQHCKHAETRPLSTSCSGICPETFACAGKTTRAPYFRSHYVMKLHTFFSNSILSECRIAYRTCFYFQLDEHPDSGAVMILGPTLKASHVSLTAVSMRDFFCFHHK